MFLSHYKLELNAFNFKQELCSRLKTYILWTLMLVKIATPGIGTIGHLGHQLSLVVDCSGIQTQDLQHLRIRGQAP